MIKKIFSFFVMMFFLQGNCVYANAAVTKIGSYIISKSLSKLAPKVITKVIPKMVPKVTSKLVPKVASNAATKGVRAMTSISPINYVKTSKPFVNAASMLYGKKPLKIIPLSMTSLRKYPILKTNNMKYFQKQFPNANIKYVRRLVDTPIGKAWGTFPQFEGTSLKLPADMLVKNETTQFKYCTRELAKLLEKNPMMKKQFSKEALEAISRGEAQIPGYTWHHTYETGKVQLVDRALHEAARHSGGNMLWGPGSEAKYELLSKMAKEVANVM